MKIIFFAFILTVIDYEVLLNDTVYGESVFRVSSYNVENLFDLKKNGMEYKDYVPGTRYGWDRFKVEKKNNNIADVIQKMQSDIVALQEIESSEALAGLKLSLRKKGVEYPFSVISDSGVSIVKCAVLSKFRICGKKEIRVDGAWRNILRVSIEIEGKELIVYNNHWLSRNHFESKRIKAAKALMNDVATLKPGAEFIVVGDLNSDYDEYKRIRSDYRINDTSGTTGINHILKTIEQKCFVGKKMLCQKNFSGCMYNLWLEKSESDRWSYIYSGRKCSLDHILIPASLCDDRKIDYKENSFNVYKPEFLLRNDAIFRWQRTGSGVHKGEGFSDHLPVYADFKLVN